jgi:hypothetical protein
MICLNLKTSGRVAADAAAATKAGSHNSCTRNPFLDLLLLAAKVDLDVVCAQSRATAPFSRFLGCCPNVKY